MTAGEWLVVLPLTLLCALFPFSVALLLSSIQRRLTRIEQQLAELANEQTGRAARAGRPQAWSEPATPQARPARAEQRTPA
jgi:hypothetical protein